MFVLVIEDIIKAMKSIEGQQAIGEIKGENITIDLNSLVVTYDSQQIDLASILGTKGGYRYFFLCPDCGRRCRKLYKRYLCFSCGTCQQVHKQTLNRSKTDCQYYFNLALKEARKIDPSYYPEKGYVDYDNFPSRPKRMRRTTYWNHYRRFESYLDKGTELWLAGIK